MLEQLSSDSVHHLLNEATIFVANLVFIAGALGLAMTSNGLRYHIGTLTARLRCLPILAVVSIPAVFGFAMPLAVTIVHGVPRPSVSDEFSYLLASDTFAHGRLTNPTPPAPEHFETFEELIRPSYASKYPPGQGILLAIGQILFGQPIIGVFMAGAMASAATSWMLLAWFPRSLALLGGVFTAIHPLLTKWDTSYYGGALAFAGGAFVLGATARLLQRPARSGARGLVVGSFILALTRPFEGGVVVIGCLAALAVHWFRDRSARSALAGTALFWLISVAVGGIFQGIYNHSVTGHFTKLPYLEFAEQYEAVPFFLFLPYDGEKHYSSEVLRDWYQAISEKKAFERGRKGAIAFYFKKAMIVLDRLIFGSLFEFLFVFSPLALPSGFTYFIGILVFFAMAMAAETWIFLHYLAPALPLWVALVISGARFVIRTAPHREIGRMIVFSSFLAFVALGLVPVIIGETTWNAAQVAAQANVTHFLEHQPGHHLVIIRYGLKHNAQFEWVHNSASLSDQRIIWARDLGPEASCDLLRAFGDRTLWTLDADEPNALPLKVSRHTELATCSRAGAAAMGDEAEQGAVRDMVGIDDGVVSRW